MALDRPRRLLKLLLAQDPRFYLGARRAWGVAQYLARRPHEPDFAVFALFADREGLFLDIGANTGQSALSFRLFNRRAPILSVEPNRLHAGDLRLVGRIVRQFRYALCAASDAPGSATLYVPMYKRLPLTGEASFSREDARRSWWLRRQLGEVPADVEVAEIPIELRRIDDMELVPPPAWVKIDVEGAEPAVIRGMRETLARHRPVLFVEKADTWEEARDLLAGLGYRPFVFRPADRGLVPFAGQPALNLVYLAEDPPRGA